MENIECYLLDRYLDESRILVEIKIKKTETISSRYYELIVSHKNNTLSIVSCTPVRNIMQYLYINNKTYKKLDFITTTKIIEKIKNNELIKDNMLKDNYNYMYNQCKKYSSKNELAYDNNKKLLKKYLVGMKSNEK